MMIPQPCVALLLLFPITEKVSDCIDGMKAYRIAGNFCERKFLRMREIEHFANNISRISAIALSLSTKNKTFADNIFANSL